MQIWSVAKRAPKILTSSLYADLSCYFLSYWWSLLYCLVFLLAAIRRFCFTFQVDWTACSQVIMPIRLSHRSRSELMFYGNEVEWFDSRLPSKLDWYNSSMKTIFFKLRDSFLLRIWIYLYRYLRLISFWNCLAILRFLKISDSQWELEAKSWDRELTT